MWLNAHSGALNPNQAAVPLENQHLGADWSTVLQSNSLKDRKYTQYQVDFPLRKRTEAGPPSSPWFWLSRSTQEALRILGALLPVRFGEGALQPLTEESLILFSLK